ncbi:hypothetical protein RNP74_13575, partial [Escherichia coli]|nr:hypothetical protein [Escherichia coli]
MKRLIPVALLTALLAGCAHDSPCVPVYDDQGRLVHTNGNDSNLLIVFYVQIMPDDFVMQLHR